MKISLKLTLNLKKKELISLIEKNCNSIKPQKRLIEKYLIQLNPKNCLKFNYVYIILCCFIINVD